MDSTVRSHSSNRRLSHLRGWRLFAVAASIAFLLMLLIRSFLFEVFYIPSASMEPTLQSGDRMVVSPGNQDIERGDIVVFDGRGSFDPYTGTSEWASAPLKTLGQWLGISGSDTVYVKRVIGMSGDEISCCGPDGSLTVNGEKLEENYLADQVAPSTQKFLVTVPEGRIWVMGDNRPESQDSRSLMGSPGGGMIRQEKVIGEPVMIIWPVNRWASF